MKELLFDSWHQWKVCFLSGCKKAAWGIGRIITCLLLGVLSVIRWLWRLLVGFVRREPAISVGAFVVMACLVWVVTFVSMRARAVGAEQQRDSISYEYSQFKESHGYGD